MVTCHSHPVLSQCPVLLYYMQINVLFSGVQICNVFRLTHEKLLCTSHHLFPLLLFHIHAPPFNTTRCHIPLVARRTQGSCLVANNRHLPGKTISGELRQNGHVRGFAAFFPWEGSFCAVGQLWENMEWTTMWMTYVATALRTLSFFSWLPDAE